MIEPYQLTYNIMPAIIRLISDVSEQLGRLSVLADGLRRINRIRTIQGSLAIKGNAILEDKRVIAPPKDIQETHADDR